MLNLRNVDNEKPPPGLVAGVFYLLGGKPAGEDAAVVLNAVKAGKGGGRRAPGREWQRIVSEIAVFLARSPSTS